jgi:tight adherence protein B
MPTGPSPAPVSAGWPHDSGDDGVLAPAPLVAALSAGASACLLMVPRGAELAAVRRTPRSLPVVAVLVIAFVGPHDWVVPLLVLAPASWGVRLLWRRRATARLADVNAARMAEMCDMLAAELSSGQAPDAALREAAATWPLLVPVADVARLGGDVPAALREAAEEPGAGGLRLLAGAWRVSRRTGGGRGAATRRTAVAVRREQSTRGVVAGELASARATARLMAGLPVLALLMGSGAGADPWSFLLRTPLGLGCLAGGLATGIAGLLWIEQIARGVDS